MTTYTIDARSSASTTHASVRYPDGTLLGSTQPAALSVPASQMYFWSRVWQEHEAEAAADIAAGRLERFDNASDAIRWLLSD